MNWPIIIIRDYKSEKAYPTWENVENLLQGGWRTGKELIPKENTNLLRELSIVFEHVAFFSVKNDEMDDK